MNREQAHAKIDEIFNSIEPGEYISVFIVQVDDFALEQHMDKEKFARVKDSGKLRQAVDDVCDMVDEMFFEQDMRDLLDKACDELDIEEND